jgi:hypothetical protein
MSDDIEGLGDEELVSEYRDTVEFRTIESEEGQVSPKQINLQQALRDQILERMNSAGTNERTTEVYTYVRDNPDCSYSEILGAVGEVGETIDAIYQLRRAGEIYEPNEGKLRATEE